MKNKKKIDFKDTEIKVKIVKASRPPAELTYAYGDVRGFGAIKRVYIKSRHLDEINDDIQELLEEHSDMEMLLISGNLEKIRGLKNLPNLKFLFLGSNAIKKIEGLDTLENLLLLELARNKIKKIEGLENLTRLRHLDLNNNDIEKIEGLGSLTHLEYLNLYRNPVYRWAKRKFGGVSMDRKKMKHPQALVKYCQTGTVSKSAKRVIGGEIEQRKIPRREGASSHVVDHATNSNSIASRSTSFTGLEIDFQTQRLCPACGKILDKESEFCKFCGVNLKDIGNMDEADEISLEFAKTTLTDADPKVRKEAVETLGSFKQDYALGVLTYVLFHDPNEKVRKEAADELGDIHHPYSVNALKKALKDKSSIVRKEVIGSLKELKKKVLD